MNTKNTVFEHSDYRDLINNQLEQKIGRGSKVKLADVLNCHPGYISQVLNKSKIHFTPENILRIASFLDLGTQEEEFLILLLEHEKAGSKELRNFWQKKIQLIKKENAKVEKQVGKVTTELDAEAKSIYYSHWSYVVIHMMVSIERYKKSEAISKHLSLSKQQVSKVLQFLSEKKLIEKVDGEYNIGPTRIHLPASSPLVKMHHQNFRQMGLGYLDQENDFDLRYSSVLTLGQEDAIKIKNLVLKLIKDKEAILIPSPNEDIIGLNLDLFKIART